MAEDYQNEKINKNTDDSNYYDDSDDSDDTKKNK